MMGVSEGLAATAYFFGVGGFGLRALTPWARRQLSVAAALHFLQ